MSIRRFRPVRFLFACVGAATWAGTLGTACSGLSIDLPLPGGGAITFNTMEIELVNTTAYPVEPRLFVDPDDDAFIVDEEENRIRIVPPVNPGEVFAMRLPCADTGSIQTDHAVLITALDLVESDNDPTVRKYTDFECGDTVSFIFIDEIGGDFFTRVEVNGVFVED